jgi:hypothetical protein
MRQSSVVYLMIGMFLSLPGLLSAQKQPANQPDSPKAVKQIPVRRPAQSPFYDALALYFTVNNYKAYPVYIGNTKSLGYTTTPQSTDDSGKTSGKPRNPLFPHGPNIVFRAGMPTPRTDTGSQTAVNFFRLVECATGKVLADTALGLETLDDSAYTYNTPADSLFRESVLDSLLARNSGMPVTDSTTRADIRGAFNQNPYIQALLASKKSKAPGVNTLTVPINSGPSLFGGSAPSVTSLAEGLTDFLVGRVNEEFNDAFIVHVYHALHDVPEFAILFPNTLESLNKIQITNYSASLSAIKSAYTVDIKAILSNVGKLATIPRYQNLINEHPVLTALFLSCDLLDMINKQTVPAEILYQVGIAPYILQTQRNNYSSVVKLAALLSNTFRDVSLGQQNPERMGWIDVNRFRFINGSRDIFNTFMGLLAQQAGGIQFFDDHNNVIFDFQTALFDPTNRAAVLTGQYLLHNFTQTAANVNSLIGTLKSGTGAKASTSDYVTGYIGIANELLNLANKCLEALPTSANLLAIDQKITKIRTEYIPLLQKADTVLSQLEGADYSMAVYTTDRLIEQLTSQYAAKLSSDSAAAVAADNKDGLAAVEKEQAELQRFKSDFLQYGLFIASVASAKSASDISAAISAFALPKGSSRIKKEHTFSVGINAYVGPYYGINHSYAGLSLPKTEWGLTAPVGVGANWGISQFLFLHQFSLSLFAGIIDVGAIFAYKVQTDSTLKSDIELGQLLSPSVSVVFGLPIINKYNLPISIGCNVQWGPKLRSVTETGNSVLPLLTKRVTIFAAFDLPIINFYTSKKLTKAP